jgi:ZIP family zinc transporter
MLALQLPSIFVALLGTITGCISSFIFNQSIGKSGIGNLIATAAGMMLGCALVQIHECMDISGTFTALASCALGLLMMFVLDQIVGNILDRDAFQMSGLRGDRAVRLLVMLIGLIIHSIGEGLSLGLAAASNSSAGTIMATTLAVHNIPETAALVFSYRAKGLTHSMSMLFAVLSNLPQTIVAIPAFKFFSSSALLVNYGMGASAGCMLYAVFNDVYPEAVSSIGKQRSLYILAMSCALVALFDITSHIHIR